MAHYKDLLGSKYLSSADLENDNGFDKVTVKITKFEKNEVENDRGKETVNVIHLDKFEIPMILSKVNVKRLHKLFKTIDFETWINKPVTLQAMRNNPALKDMVLLRKGMRLSIQPVTREQFEAICDMGSG